MESEHYINSYHYYTLLIHVIAGIISVLMGILAIIATPKGNKLHRKSGIIYFWSMVVIFLTSLLAIVFFKFNIFLFGISMLSFFTSFSGYRALKRKKPNQVKWYDKLVAYLGVISGLGLIIYGGYVFFYFNNIGLPILCIVFGLLLATNAYKDVKHFKKEEYERLWWWFHHLNMMMAAFIATVTAALVNNIYKVIQLGAWDFVFWLLPTVILVPLIVRWNNYYKKKFKIE